MALMCGPRVVVREGTVLGWQSTREGRKVKDRDIARRVTLNDSARPPRMTHFHILLDAPDPPRMTHFHSLLHAPVPPTAYRPCLTSLACAPSLWFKRDGNQKTEKFI